MSLIRITTEAWEGLTGLTGTIAVQVVDANNSVLIARNTASVTEFPPNSGIYGALIQEPTVGYYWIFDDGTDYDVSEWKTPTTAAVAATGIASASSFSCDTDSPACAPVAGDLTDSIVQNASAPRRASGDSGSAEQHSIPDQIAADRYAKSQKAAKTGLGIRHVKLIPPGASDVQFGDR